MNHFQKSWLPALPPDESSGSGKQRGTDPRLCLTSGFAYNGFVLAPAGSTAKPRRPKRVPPSGTASAASIATTQPSAPAVWHSSLSPFDRIITPYTQEPLPEGQRRLRRIASADHVHRKTRERQAFVARRGLRYAEQLRQHVARSSLLNAIKRREKYLAWAQALLRL